jgi:hypothetical protein
MSPARMQRHIEVRVILPDHTRDKCRGRFQRIKIDGEFLEIAREPGIQHFMRAFAHGFRGKQGERGLRAGILERRNDG